jgi:hypothetical protein
MKKFEVYPIAKNLWIFCGTVRTGKSFFANETSIAFIDGASKNSLQEMERALICRKKFSDEIEYKKVIMIINQLSDLEVIRNTYIKLFGDHRLFE